MSTIHDLDKINAEAVMTLSEIGLARYDEFLGKTLAQHKGSIARIKLKGFVRETANMELRMVKINKLADQYN